ncbi:MAG: PD-(D/E)XK nuclease family protein [Elusimicrobia bacterium]|nr:PD-(D/E)XK nuclease family protein [Elusimicrobiota bacterium]
MRPLSHSSISLYRECPQKYKFKYIDKLPEKPKHFFSFGHSVHTALEFFYGVPALPAPSLEEVLGHYKKNWESKGYKDTKAEAEYFEEGQRILTSFYQKHIGDFKPPLFAEYGFTFEVDGVPVTGKVDRIDKLENNKIAIVDYKTGKAFDLSRVKEDSQLTMYQMACEELLGLKVDSLTFYHLPSLTALTVIPHSQGQITNLRKTIVQVSESIQEKSFDPKPEERKCSWCDYKPLCPVFKHLYATQDQGASAAFDGDLFADHSQDENLAALVDRYGKIKEEAKEVEDRIEDVKGQILDLLKKKGYVRAFGKNYEVSAAHEEKWDFKDKEQVLEVLRQAGFYDKVLAPSAPQIQKLMKDPGLPPLLRMKLEQLGTLVQHPVLRCKKVDEE